jgi:hypothetical protein
MIDLLTGAGMLVGYALGLAGLLIIVRNAR